MPDTPRQLPLPLDEATGLPFAPDSPLARMAVALNQWRAGKLDAASLNRAFAAADLSMSIADGGAAIDFTDRHVDGNKSNGGK